MALICPQCGITGWMTVVRRRWRRPSYWCERCGCSTPDATPADEPPRAAQPEPTRDLYAIMPAAMADWVVRRSHSSAPARLDRAIVYQLYRAWDRRLATALPAFSAVVGALHAAAYDIDVAFPDAAAQPALRERAVHARTWLLRYGPDQCWILGPVCDQVDLDLVREALATIRAGAEPAGPSARAVRHALFGVDGGPRLPTLQRVFDDETIAAALEGYLRHRDRPLRSIVLANLGAERVR